MAACFTYFLTDRSEDFFAPWLPCSYSSLVNPSICVGLLLIGDLEGDGCLAVNFFPVSFDCAFEIVSLSFDCAFETVFADLALETALDGSVFLDLAVRISSSYDSGFCVSLTATVGLTFFSFVITFLSVTQSENYLNSLIFDKHLLPLLVAPYCLSVDAVFLSSLLMKKSRTD